MNTSIHNINADKKLNPLLRRLWLFLNWLNNIFPNAQSHDLIIRDFQVDVSENYWNQVNIKSSPSRKLSDLFWCQLPWQLIQDELGQIDIFDTGCGNGNYSVRLQTYSQNKIANYTGVDVYQQENWDTISNLNPSFKFQVANSENIYNKIPTNANLFISQSAIEHFENDLLYFKQIYNFAKNSSKNIVQIHLFPSAACLRLYKLHGVRQYTPRTISKVTKLFREFSYSILYQLGGRACNQLHWDAITNPLSSRTPYDMRQTNTHEYDKKLRQAIIADSNNSYNEPSFYALVIHSNWKRKIFM